MLTERFTATAKIVGEDTTISGFPVFDFYNGKWLMYPSEVEIEEDSIVPIMNRVEAHTVFGNLYAEVSGDPAYPGLVICIELKDREAAYNKQLALVECTSGIPKDGGHSLRLMVWNSDDSDNYTDDFTFLEQTPDDEEERLSAWEKYLQYLKDWVESHAEPSFLGMTPASFDEWLNNEYREDGKA